MIRPPRLIAFVLLVSVLLPAWSARADRRAALRLVENQSLVDLRDVPADEAPLELDDLPAVRAALWNKYRRLVLADEHRAEEYQSFQIVNGGHTMRFGLFEIGDRPQSGYPLYICLHGGGRAPAELNDRAWRHMLEYYRRSVGVGVYIAPRGIVDWSNLHSRPESFSMYDRMIENAIVYNNVDPNRVYLLGFSAGGDGVYQVSTRMPDRYGAVNMSAGHPNDAKPVNLMNLPMLLQVGEKDDAYSRNIRTPEYYLSLLDLREQYGTGYVTDVFVHLDMPHNFHDEDPEQAPRQILADPRAWLEEGDRTTRSVNTNAVAWVSQYERTPAPERVVWQLYNRAMRPRLPAEGLPGSEVDLENLNYWLDVSQADVSGIERVDVELDPENNAIIVHQGAPGMRFLLNEEMLDLEQPISLQVEEQSLSTKVRPTLSTLVRTLSERGDPNYMFVSEITITRDEDGQWAVETP